MNRFYLLFLIIGTSLYSSGLDWMGDIKNAYDKNKDVIKSVKKISKMDSGGILNGAKDILDKKGISVDGLDLGVSVFNVVLNNDFGSLITQTTTDILGDTFSGALNVCYIKDSVDGEIEGLDLNFCKYLNLPSINTNFCAALPSIPGYKKIKFDDGDLLDGYEGKLKSYCNSFFDADNKETNESEVASKTIGKKILENDPADEDLTHKTLDEKDNVKSVSDSTDIKNLSNFEHKNNISGEIERPLEDLKNADNVISKNAHSYYMRLAEKAKDGKADNDVKTAIINAEKINGKYKDYAGYIDGRAKIVNRLSFLEEQVYTYNLKLTPPNSKAKSKNESIDYLNDLVLPELMGINAKIKSFQFQMSQGNDVDDKLTAQKNKYKNYIVKITNQYNEVVDKWVTQKTKHYHSFERTGVISPTQDYVDNYAQDKTPQAIHRAAIVNKINRQVNREARDILAIKRQGIKFKQKFKKDFKNIQIMSQVFNEELARQSVGL